MNDPELVKLGDKTYHIEWTLNELMLCVDCEENLYTFLQHAWRFIDPAPFKPSWAIEAVCEHLEAVCDGTIRKLLINIPPRMPVAASALIPTYERGLVRLDSLAVGEHVLTHKGRFRRVQAVHRQGKLPVLCLTTRHGREVTAAPEHPFLTPFGWTEIQHLKPDDVIGIVPQRISSGAPTITPEEARLLGYLTGDGSCQGTPNITVADDIEATDIHLVIAAAGFDATDQTYELTKTGGVLRRIVLRAKAGTLKRPQRKNVGPVREFVTRHGLWGRTSYTKTIPAAVLNGSDLVVRSFIGAYWACDGFVSTKGPKRDGTEREDLHIGCDSVSKTLLLQMQVLLLRLGIDSRIRTKTTNIKTKKQGDRYTSYVLSISDQDNCWRFATLIDIHHAKGTKLAQARHRRFDFDHVVVGNVVESVKPAGTEECICLTVEEDASFVANGFAVHNSKSSVCSVAFPAWVWAQEYVSPTSGPRVPFLHASYGFTLSLRDSVKCRRLIKSTWYRKLWGDRFNIVKEQDQKVRFRNNLDGERLITSIGSGVTGEGGNIIIVDDPNAADEVLSEATIRTTNEDWWDGTMGTRLNDPKTGAFVVIQQRLGEEDLSGHILEREPGEWVHLMLPMHYDKERASMIYPSAIGWDDPRTQEGQLLWPERFGEVEVNNLAKRLGSWKCSPGEAPVLMDDLSMRRIDEIKIGDSIIGFERKKRTDTYGRYHLRPSKVTEIHSFVAPVVKMTLDSGEVIRCTRDHKWYMKDKGSHRPAYLPVTLGRSSLARVCPPRLPVLTREEERLAGWLAGFFDGEGSVTDPTSLVRQANYTPSAQIMFYQGAGRNLPLCNKLEHALHHFGFEYTYAEDQRKENKTAACYGYRAYHLTKSRSPFNTLQRFLHVVQPTKWRDRIIAGAMKANFIAGREKVVKIEPDGEEVVYGLTTETGNYVVWGLASSNSAGQLEQRPEPQGGGIIKRKDWQLWPPEPPQPGKLPQYPPCSYVLASLDTAYTQKTMNDPSAMTVWGVFKGEAAARDVKVTPTDTVRVFGETSARVILLAAWAERLEFNALLQKIAITCAQFQVDKLIVENKAAGESVGQEIRRLMNENTIEIADPVLRTAFAKASYSVQMIDPKQIDKVARLYSTQHLFEDKMIYAPDTTWADLVINQCGTFPNAKHDDLVDTVSQALRHLRDLGMLERGVETTAMLDDSLRYTGKASQPLYPGTR